VAQNTDISIPPRMWTLLTNSDVSALRIQVLGRVGVLLKATVGAVPPTSLTGGVSLAPGGGLTADQTLAQLFPGVPGANRVYAYATGGTVVSVSHA
jgi:hypothetical protein